MKSKKFQSAVAAIAAALLVSSAAFAQRPDRTDTASTPVGDRTKMAPVNGPLPADLQIVKTVGTVPTGGGQGTFNLVITNFGPGAALGPIVVNDTLTGPATIVGFSPSGPFTCTGIVGTSVTCSHGGSLNAGQSVSLSLTVSANAGAAGMVQNCATVHSTKSKDPKDSNNRDCTCMDFKRCYDFAIDISTGSLNGAPIAIGATDSHWTVKPPGATTASPAVATNDALPPWVTPPPPAQWISSSTSATAVGTYVYNFHFDLGNDWPNRICTLSLKWAVDNNLSLQVDQGSPFVVSSPPNWPSSFNQLHNAPTTIVPPTGQHDLTATVTNAHGPTGLLLVGKVNCVCEKWPVPVPATSTR